MSIDGPSESPVNGAMSRCAGCQAYVPTASAYCAACGMLRQLPVPSNSVGALSIAPGVPTTGSAHAGARKATLTLPTGLRSWKGAAVIMVPLVLLIGFFGYTMTSHGGTVAASTGTGLVAHGQLISTGPLDGSSLCPLDDTALTATGDDGSVVGATALKGTVTKGACTYDYSFSLKSTLTVTFHTGSFPVTGPDGHDGQVLSSALAKPVLLVVM
jgi:hypothetical protein